MSLLVDAARGNPTERTPIWIMRQAGRHLPEYRALRNQHGFHTMMSQPDLITEVTLQPVRRYYMDGAILYSDILVIPEAMGLPFELVSNIGPVFENPVNQKEQLLALQPARVEKLDHVFQGVKSIRAELQADKALIGFSGAPWTIATYMVEGQPSKDFRTIRSLSYAEPEAFHHLMDVLTQGIIHYVTEQVKAGADIIQIFDTNAGYLTRAQFETISLPFLNKIVKAVQDTGVPVILFVKGGNWTDLTASTGADVIGVDWAQPLSAVREQVGEKVSLQGNLDPAVLLAPENVIRQEAIKVLESYGWGHRHIFNLGHGITPDVPVEAVQTLVETVREESTRFHQPSDEGVATYA